MSSVDQEETVAECVQYGAEEYLVKPVRRRLRVLLLGWAGALQVFAARWHAAELAGVCQQCSKPGKSALLCALQYAC